MFSAEGPKTRFKVIGPRIRGEMWKNKFLPECVRGLEFIGGKASICRKTHHISEYLDNHMKTATCRITAHVLEGRTHWVVTGSTSVRNAGLNCILSVVLSL